MADHEDRKFGFAFGTHHSLGRRRRRSRGARPSGRLALRRGPRRRRLPGKPGGLRAGARSIRARSRPGIECRSPRRGAAGGLRGLHRLREARRDLLRQRPRADTASHLRAAAPHAAGTPGHASSRRAAERNSAVHASGPASDPARAHDAAGTAADAREAAFYTSRPADDSAGTHADSTRTAANHASGPRLDSTPRSLLLRESPAAAHIESGHSERIRRTPRSEDGTPARRLTLGDRCPVGQRCHRERCLSHPSGRGRAAAGAGERLGDRRGGLRRAAPGALLRRGREPLR
jgi:hypothetical protein